MQINSTSTGALAWRRTKYWEFVESRVVSDIFSRTSRVCSATLPQLLTFRVLTTSTTKFVTLSHLILWFCIKQNKISQIASFPGCPLTVTKIKKRSHYKWYKMMSTKSGIHLLLPELAKFCLWSKWHTSTNSFIAKLPKSLEPMFTQFMTLNPFKSKTNWLTIALWQDYYSPPCMYLR